MSPSRVVVLSSILVACASSTPTEAPKGEVAEATPEPGGDAGAAEAAPAAIDVQGCGVKRVSDPDTCAEACDARLLLPSQNGSYCTVQCRKDVDCGGLLACPETVGACMPKCASDATCKAEGFERCDRATGACDSQ